MTDADLIGLVLGIFLPGLIAIIQRRKWPDLVRTLVAYAVYVLTTALTMWFTASMGDPPEDARAWVRLFLIILATAYTSFAVVWKPTGLAAHIEERTSPKPPSPPPGSHQSSHGTAS